MIGRDGASGADPCSLGIIFSCGSCRVQPSLSGGPGRPPTVEVDRKRGRSRESHANMFTARAATSAIVSNEIADSTIMRSFARAVRGIVSVGENAVALVNDT